MKKKQQSTYLQKLKFNPELKKSAVYKYITNIRFVILVLLGIIPFGIYSLITLPRTLNPEINLPYIAVTSVLPGASPEEVERLVTVPLEDAIESIDGVVNMESTSSQNVSNITVEFSSRISSEKAKTEVQDAIDTVRDLPEDATDPNVFAFDIEDAPIITYAFYTEADTNSLYTKSRELKNSLENLPQIDRVETKGLPEKQIVIDVTPEIAREYGISPMSLQSRIQDALTSFPAGNVVSQNFSFTVSVEKQLDTISSLRNLPININSNFVLLGNIADVYEKQENSGLNLIRINDDSFADAVIFDVYRNKQSDITDAVKLSNNFVDEFISQNKYIEYKVISSTALDIEDQFKSLTNSFLITLFLVFATLFVFLGIRQSTIVSLSIPISFLISFSVMNATGLTLNFLTVFSLLLALGLLVDDAIVIISAMTSYMRTEKFNSNEAGMLVWKDFIVPIWSTTITTVWAFVPLLLASGIIGEFIKTIPIVVSATLIASTSVAVLITLPFAIQIFNFKIPNRVINSFKLLFFALLIAGFVALVPSEPKPLFAVSFISYVLLLIITYQSRNKYAKLVKIKNKRLKYIFSNGIINSESISNAYRKTIESILNSKKQRRRVIIFVVLFSIASYALVPLGFVVNEFFPQTDSNILYLNLEMPTGTIDSKTNENILDIAKSIENRGGLEELTISTNQSNKATISLKLDDDKISSIKFAEDLRDQFETFTAGKVTIEEQSGGPPVGSDIEVSITGDDLLILDDLTDKLIDYLDSNSDIVSTEKSIQSATSQLVFSPYSEEVLKYGLTTSEIGFWIRSYLSGFDVDSVQFYGDDIDISYRLFSEDVTLEQLNLIQIPTRTGDYIELANLGEFIAKTNPERIDRLNGKRKVTVSAGVSANASTSIINADLQKFIDNDLNLPDGYETVSGGVNEENQKSVMSILQAMVLSAVLILATMVIQLGSFRKAIIILLVIPLAVSGVFILFAITGTPLSFPALIGVLALFGIVVNNSIVIVEKINQNLAVGIKFSEAVVDGAASRVEPIVFSSITTIMGLAPITINDPLWRGLGGAIIAGLMVSGITMLFFIPTVYYIWFEAENK